MYRSIDTEAWDDPWFSELTPNAKLLFLYLLTNRRSTLCGVFEITIRAMAFETGLDDETVRESLLALRPKVTWYELEKTVFVRNFFRRQNKNAHEKLIIGARKDVAKVAALVRADVLREYPELADPNTPEPMPLPSKEIAPTYPIGRASIPLPDTRQDKTIQDVDVDVDENARVRAKAATPATVEVETTAEEREIVAIIQRVPGMAPIPDSEIVLHLRDVLSCRDGPPLSFASLKAEAIKFRDYHTDRRGTASTGKWRGWQNALMNWFTRAKELPKHEIAAQNGHHDEPITADERRNAERDERLRAAQARGLIADAGRPTGTGGRVGLSAGSDGLP